MMMGRVRGGGTIILPVGESIQSAINVIEGGGGQPPISNMEKEST